MTLARQFRQSIDARSTQNQGYNCPTEPVFETSRHRISDCEPHARLTPPPERLAPAARRAKRRSRERGTSSVIAPCYATFLRRTYEAVALRATPLIRRCFATTPSPARGEGVARPTPRRRASAAPSPGGRSGRCSRSDSARGNPDARARPPRTGRPARPRSPPCPATGRRLRRRRWCLSATRFCSSLGVEDRRAVARADVVALPVAGRRVVDLEEELQQLAVADLRRVEDDLDRLGVLAVVAIGGVRRRRRRYSRPASR